MIITQIVKTCHVKSKNMIYIKCEVLDAHIKGIKMLFSCFPSIIKL